MNPTLLLVGAGGHAAACIDVIERADRFRIAGLLGTAEEVGKKVLGYPVLGADADIETFAREYRNAIVCVGQIKSPDLRVRLFQALKNAGYDSPVIVSPLAHVSRHASIDEGTIVMHGAVVNSRATIGRNCIINSKALIEHDVHVGDHCHVATASVVNGDVTIGEGTFVGSNSTVRQAVRIGNRCVIGMGRLVKNDCPDGAVVSAAGDAR